MPKRNVKWLLKESKRWVNAENEALLWASSLSEMQKDPRVAPAVLNRMAFWLDGEAAQRVLAGDPEGWAGLERATYFLWWYVRSFSRMFEMTAGTKGRLHIAYPTGCLAMAMSLGLEEVAGWVGERLVRSVASGDGLCGDWSDRPLEAFLVRIYSLWAGIAPVEGLPVSGGVFARLLRGWEDPREVSVSLTGICEYRLAEMDAPNKISEFFALFARVFPAEIHAVLSCRRRLGLETYEISHPLMQTALASVPLARPRFDPTSDVVLCRAVNVLQAELPGC